MSRHLKVASGWREGLRGGTGTGGGVLPTACRVTFRSGTVTRQGTVRCVDERVIKMVSRLLPLAWLESAPLRKGRSGSGWSNKEAAAEVLPEVIAPEIWVIMYLLMVVTGVILLVIAQSENNLQRPDICGDDSDYA